MAEKFLAFLEGGPFPGQYELPEFEWVEDQENPGKQKKIPYTWTWPLQKFLPAKGYKVGAYVKIWESKGQPKPGEARGARYEWDEDSIGIDLSK